MALEIRWINDEHDMERLRVEDPEAYRRLTSAPCAVPARAVADAHAKGEPVNVTVRFADQGENPDSRRPSSDR